MRVSKAFVNSYEISVRDISSWKRYVKFTLCFILLLFNFNELFKPILNSLQRGWSWSILRISWLWRCIREYRLSEWILRFLVLSRLLLFGFLGLLFWESSVFLILHLLLNFVSLYFFDKHLKVSEPIDELVRVKRFSIIIIYLIPRIWVWINELMLRFLVVRGQVVFNISSVVLVVRFYKLSRVCEKFRPGLLLFLLDVEVDLFNIHFYVMLVILV